MSARSIETRLASIELSAEDFVHIRLKEDIKLDAKGFAEILAARKELSKGRRLCVLAIVPDDMDFEINIMSVDHYAGEDPASFTTAFAIVTAASLYTRLFELYVLYFKLPFPVKVFGDEASALAWLSAFTS